MKRNSILFGILLSLLVFGGGYFISQFIWKYVDGGYVHGPGLSLLFLFVLFLLCVVWMIMGYVKRRSVDLGRFWIGSALVNTAIVGYIVISLTISFLSTDNTNIELPSQSITISKDSTAKGGVVTDQNGDTVIYIKNDSILVDRRDKFSDTAKKK